MGFLTEPIEEKVVYQKRKYWVNASFDTVLQIQSLFREEELPESLKLQQALKDVYKRQGISESISG